MNRFSYIVIDLYLPDAILLENRMRIYTHYMGLSAAIWINFYAHRKIGIHPPRDYVRQTRHERTPSPFSTELSNHYYIENPIIVFDSWLNQGLYNIVCHRCPWCVSKDVFIIIILHNSDTDNNIALFLTAVVFCSDLFWIFIYIYIYIYVYTWNSFMYIKYNIIYYFLLVYLFIFQIKEFRQMDWTVYIIIIMCLLHFYSILSIRSGSHLTHLSCQQYCLPSIAILFNLWRASGYCSRSKLKC